MNRKKIADNKEEKEEEKWENKVIIRGKEGREKED